MKIVRSLAKITKKTVKTLEAHPVAKTMFKGTMTKKAYIHYLIQTVKYVAYSPPFLQAAACGAMAKYPDLAAIFQVKSAEETDHDNLALEDLEKLGIDKPSVIETPACAAVDEYIQYHVREIAEGVPAAFFGACWVLETLAIACGPKALKGLRNNPN
ncbi:MAG TPA: hypothetical protein PK156_47375, partial [Polyangium sp.]|nr:hypothetical protein [Polyangium sp.]